MHFTFEQRSAGSDSGPVPAQGLRQMTTIRVGIARKIKNKNKNSTGFSLINHLRKSLGPYPIDIILPVSRILSYLTGLELAFATRCADAPFSILNGRESSSNSFFPLCIFSEE
jgi:hypothetical protein